MTLTGSVSTVSPFSIVGTGILNINAGVTQQVLVSFNPGSTGSFSNVVAFASNGGNSTYPVSGASGTGTQLGVSPASHDFDGTPVGATSDFSFVVTNSGGSTLTGTASISQGPFTILSGTPFSLLAHGTTNLTVRFAPNAEGNFTGALLVSSGGGGSTNPLSGSGIVAPSAAFNASPTNGLAPLTVN